MKLKIPHHQLEIYSHLSPNQSKIIKNLTSQNIYLYWSNKRDDAPDYSECTFLCKVTPGNSRSINYYNPQCYLIASDYDVGSTRCYYFELKQILSLKMCFLTQELLKLGRIKEKSINGKKLP